MFVKEVKETSGGDGNEDENEDAVKAQTPKETSRECQLAHKRLKLSDPGGCDFQCWEECRKYSAGKGSLHSKILRKSADLPSSKSDSPCSETCIISTISTNKERDSHDNSSTILQPASAPCRNPPALTTEEEGSGRSSEMCRKMHDSTPSLQQPCSGTCSSPPDEPVAGQDDQISDHARVLHGETLPQVMTCSESCRNLHAAQTRGDSDDGGPPEGERTDYCAEGTAPDEAAPCSDPFRVLHELRPRPGRTLFFSRHGESLYNVENRIGGDPVLTAKGSKYAEEFGRYINALALPNLKVWTSSLTRTLMTAAEIRTSNPRKSWPILDEIKSGCLDGLTYEEVRLKFPKEHEARIRDKLKYRYPGGESYLDCCSRVLPFLREMEQEDQLVVVAHQGILRCIFGYLLKVQSPQEIPHIKIPQHTVIQVTLTEDGRENVVKYIPLLPPRGSSEQTEPVKENPET